MKSGNLKIVLINSIVCFLLFFFIDFVCYINYYKQRVALLSEMGRDKPHFNYNLEVKNFDELYEDIKKERFRKPVGLQYHKKPIILFGCSYAYGYVLKENQIVSYKLSELTKRPVFNRGYIGWAPQHMLYQLKRADFYDEVKEPEYIFYFFIEDHIRRLNMSIADVDDMDKELYLRYELENGKITEKKPLLPFLYGFSMVKSTNLYFAVKRQYSKKYKDMNFDLMEAIFLESKKEAQRHYPGVKFVILKFPSVHQQDWYYNTNRWRELEKNGFKIIDVNELTGKNICDKEYVFKPVSDIHPNEKAWDLIAVNLTKRLQL